MVDYEFSPTAKCVKPAKCQRIFYQRISSWLKMSDSKEPRKRAWGGNKGRKPAHMCWCDSDMAEHLSSLCFLMRGGFGLNYCFAVALTCFFWHKLQFLNPLPIHPIGSNIWRPTIQLATFWSSKSVNLWRDIKHYFQVYHHHNFETWPMFPRRCNRLTVQMLRTSWFLLRFQSQAQTKFN